MDAGKDNILDSYFWSQSTYGLEITKPIYNMLWFANPNRSVIKEVYEQMNIMLGQIKDIVQPRDVDLYEHIHVEVEKKWKKLNIPLHALAYVFTPKYYIIYHGFQHQ